MAKKGGWRKSDGDGEGEAWLATYGDLVTLLMAFFVLLYAFSSTDAAKFEMLVEGLAKPFGNTAAADGLLPDNTGLAGEQPPAAGPPPGVGVDLPTPKDTPEDDKGEPDAELTELRKELLAALELNGYETVVDLSVDPRGLVLSIATDRVLFAVGSAEISARGEELVASIGPALAKFPNEIIVEGHTDNQPLRRGNYTNWNLSTDRAVAVLSLLEEDHGIDPTRLSAAGYGEWRPRSPNDTVQGRSANRRIELVVAANTDGTLPDLDR